MKNLPIFISLPLLVVVVFPILFLSVILPDNWIDKIVDVLTNTKIDTP